MNNIRNFINYFHLLPLLILILLGLYGIQALFHPGLYSAHDIWHQVARLYHYSAAVSDGATLPTWISTLANGYGYPLFYFSYHFPWLMGLPFIWLGFSIFSTLKILFGLAFMAAGFAMYWLAFVIFKNRIAALAVAGLYLISPYHFFTIFVSASIGTVFQFALLPLIVLGIFQTIREHKMSGTLLLATTAAASILSHLMTFVFLVPYLTIYTLVLLIEQRHQTMLLFKSIKLLFTAALIALGLSAFYVIPTLLYLPLVRAGEGTANFQTLYLGGFVTLKQLLYSTWGFSPISENAATSDISFQIGIAQWLIIAATAFLLSFFAILRLLNNYRRRRVEQSKPFIFLRRILDFKFLSKFWATALVIGSLLGLSIWLMLSSSILVWDLIARYFTLDFPFRYLIVAVFLASLLAGFVIGSLSTQSLKLFGLFCIIVIALYTNRNHIKVNMYTDYALQEYIGAELTTTTFHEYLPIAADSGNLQLSQPQLIKDIPAEILYTSPTRLVIGVNIDGLRNAEVRQFDFPGQRVYINGKLLEREIDPGKLILFKLPKGYHTIEIRYQNPPIYYLGLLTSSVTIIFVLIVLLRKPK